MSPSPDATTLCTLFDHTSTAQPDRIALRSADETMEITWRQYAKRVRSIAAGLAGLGIDRGDTVALMLTNRPEFHLVDTAVVHTGATPFSIYNTNPPEMLGYLFDNADNAVVVCEQQFLPVVEAGRRLGGRVEHVVCIDGPSDGVMTLDDLEATPDPDFDFESRWRSVEPDDILTIIYTSGTTGNPKGVEITHRNILAEARVIDEIGVLGSDDRVISYLPDAHGANRFLCHYQNILNGVQLTTLADPKDAIATLTDVRPTIFFGVPRVWMKIKAGIEAELAGAPAIKRALARWAFALGQKKAYADSDRRRLGISDRVQHALAERLVLSSVRASLGLDQTQVAVTGAAPISADIHAFFVGLGIPLIGAWGMTECSCAATIDRPQRITIGTVGTAFAGVDIRLADDGEILIRGDVVMRGYRKQPDQTAAAIDATGWLSTGDIGTIDKNGVLTIVDRKKELIINAAGKNMSPANIENALSAAVALAGPITVIGDAKPYNTALISLDAEAAAKQFPGRPMAELCADAEVRTAVEEGVLAANKRLSRVEQIKKFTILPDVWEPGGPFLTPTAKLKRKPIEAAYTEIIDGMYP